MPTSPETSRPSGTIAVEHVWKRYRADRVRRRRLQDHLERIGRQIRARNRGWRWVLKDINLAVAPGETVALIGVNGSGKSTLLKVISRVTYQSAGRCEATGRVGALLEVRSGINILLTGRENIYLYGNILGLTRKQVSRRFDSIVEFAELEDAVDRQVKYYSSGMQVRLGFSIAAHLDPDILLVDEVLAVGDANFQQKCLQRISEVVARGTTLLFVSHDPAAVQAMCDRAVWLADGVARAQGPTREVLGLYRASLTEDVASVTPAERGIRVLKVEVSGVGGAPAHSGSDTEVRMVLRSVRAGRARIFLGVSEGTAMPIFTTRNDVSFPEGDFEVRCVLRNLPLPAGHYFLWANVRTTPDGGPPMDFSWRPLTAFDVLGARLNNPPAGVMLLSPVYVDTVWDVG